MTKPRPKRRLVVCGKHVANLIGEIEDCRGPQATIEVVVQQGFRGSDDLVVGWCDHGLTLSMEPPVHAKVIAALRCPVCREALAASAGPGGPLRCTRGHSFDLSKQGYAQLTAGPLTHTGDSATMVEARVRFLAGGHYDGIAAAVADAARGRWSGGLVVDAGAGTGHHATGVLRALDGAYGLALDASKASVRRAAKAHPRLDAVVCDLWQALPLADDCADVVMNVFAPRSGPEFARILRPHGALVVVTPQPEHLAELVGPLGLLRVDPAKPRRVAAELGDAFTQLEQRDLRWVMSLRRDEASALVRMGPSAWHADPDAIEAALAELDEPAHVTAAVTVATYEIR